jgi:ribonuclease E
MPIFDFLTPPQARQGSHHMSDHSKNRMLIDATHPEETRVVVLRHGRIEEFDWESASRKLLRGNIYLAKVTRVEPSLQAAFVDYGGNRHGFLAFNEIHPDYYQIPIADRQALLREEAEAEEAKAKAEQEADDALPESDEENGQELDSGEEPHHGHRHHERRSRRRDEAVEAAVETVEPARTDPPVESELVTEAPANQTGDEPSPVMAAHQSLAERLPPEPTVSEPAAPEAALPAKAQSEDDNGNRSAESIDVPPAHGLVEDQGVVEVAEPDHVSDVETVGPADAEEEIPDRPRGYRRVYKIQEVIKRRQIILVQVVKEERGNKGAALTTYLSLAGRYTVLMPNTARGGGISRKITNPADRKRLRKIVAELEVPTGMGLIVRTAGASRSKAEIKRDFEYLLRLWESVRDLTLRSTAPAVVYEEGDLIKRSIRDLYTKEIDDITVAGNGAYEEARSFMAMLMPSHEQNVIKYAEPEPLFTRFQIERQLNAMFSPFVTLPSGGYVVINQTEALVAIDVNSGKATREHSIEETALRTNLEAAEEIARQLKLRDLAGLIVIDFIDMEEKRNNRAVERKLKDSLRFDRARIQVGRISHFGLLEMSRQRLRPGVLEGSTSQCPHCQGTGIIRSVESVALAVIRAIEDRLMAGEPTNLVALTTPSVALYILNQKRHFLNDMEARYGVTITVTGSDKVQGANFQIERGPQTLERSPARPKDSAIQMGYGHSDIPVGAEEEEDADEESDTADNEPMAAHADDEDRSEAETEDADDEPRRRRRRRRRGRGDRVERHAGSNGEHTNGEGRVESQAGANVESINGHAEEDDDDVDEDGAEDIAGMGGERREGAQSDDAGEGDRNYRRGRRRGRRGGRRRRERGDRQEVDASAPRGLNADPSVPQPPASGIAAWDTFEPTVGELAAAERKGREPHGGDAIVKEAPTPPPLPIFDADPLAPVEPVRPPLHSEPRREPEARPVEQPVIETPPPRAVAVPPPLPEPEAVPPPVPDESRPRRTGWWQRR